MEPSLKHVKFIFHEYKKLPLKVTSLNRRSSFSFIKPGLEGSADIFLVRGSLNVSAEFVRRLKCVSDKFIPF